MARHPRAPRTGWKAAAAAVIGVSGAIAWQLAPWPEAADVGRFTAIGAVVYLALLGALQFANNRT